MRAQSLWNVCKNLTQLEHFELDVCLSKADTNQVGAYDEHLADEEEVKAAQLAEGD